ncbi:MAG: hypothetical protein D6708_01170 [Candidatus Dadabacteria bacterium]|nr:MAG: hypothetical protein D6708_01170 [Candidatus Dadabacteria bacterium]
MDATIRYGFRFEDGREVSVEVARGGPAPAPEGAPAWAALDRLRCPGCPLDPGATPHCPAAVSLSPLLGLADGRTSHEPVDLTVETPERTVRARTTLQRALGSLIGLVLPSSGCPHLAPFRPMARFHLPLATEEETVFRAVGSYLLARHLAGLPPDPDLAGLERVYRRVQEVNRCLAERLRAATRGDAAVNAVVLLDLLAKAVPWSIQETLDELRPWFEGCGIEGR